MIEYIKTHAFPTIFFVSHLAITRVAGCARCLVWSLGKVQERALARALLGVQSSSNMSAWNRGQIPKEQVLPVVPAVLLGFASLRAVGQEVVKPSLAIRRVEHGFTVWGQIGDLEVEVDAAVGILAVRVCVWRFGPGHEGHLGKVGKHGSHKSGL